MTTRHLPAKRHRLGLMWALSALAWASWPISASAAAHPAQALLGRFLATYERADHWVGRIHSHTVGPKGSQDTWMRVWLRKPNHSAFLIEKAPHKPASEGTKLVWHGDDPKVQLRTRFFGLPVTLQVPYQDPRLAGARGDDLMDLSVNRAVEIARHPACQVEAIGPGSWQGQRLQLVKLKSPRLLRGVTHEILGLDEVHHLPLIREMYEGSRRVYRMEVLEHQLDGPWPAGAMELS